jgi:hypothetical protein
MLFLIQYDRQLGRIIEIIHFDDANRQTAEDARLAMEIKLSREGKTNEVVLLEASSEGALRKTHGRYFNDIRKLLINTSSQIE